MANSQTPDQIAEKKAKAHQRYLRHKEYYRAYSDAWWKAHPEKRREKDRRRAPRRKESRRIYRRKWKKTESGKASAKRYAASDSRHKYWAKYYAEHADIIRNRSKAWYRANPGKHHAHVVRRRLKQQGVPNAEVIRLFIDTIKAKSRTKCYYCGHIVSTKKIHFDHIVPLSKGGAHAIENLCVACASCNLHKYATPVQDWYKLGQQILSL